MTPEEAQAKKKYEERLHEAEELWRKGRKTNNADTLFRAISMALTAREQFTRLQLRRWMQEARKKEAPKAA